MVLWQKQIKRFFDCVLDVDTAGREPQRQACACYLHDAPRDLALFRFRPIPVSFEPVEPGRCSAVLYSGSIADMIDYSLRSCVEREVTVRRCKNCGRYFPLIVHISAEYCERPTASALKWAEERGDNKIFRKYKRRFAWIKVGKIKPDDYYAWSEKAREKKAECDEGIITLEEYQMWLRES